MAEQAEKKGRGRPREFNRGEALCKALKTFWSNGYEFTTMRQLTEAMGITSPSLYCAFGAKADLFLEALAHYRKEYWASAFADFMAEPDIYDAVRHLFDVTPRILLAPGAPCGCLTVISAMTLPDREERLLDVIGQMRNDTRNLFRERLMLAIDVGQLPADCDVPAIAGALANFFEGLSLQARSGLCLSELLAISRLAIRLLPDREIA